MNILQDLFLNILNMSITSSYVIMFVILIRLLLKKAPKIFSYCLWAVVLFRLVIPFSFSSSLSFLKPIAQSGGSVKDIPSYISITAQPKMDAGMGSISNAINSSLPAPSQTSSIDPIQTVIFISSIIWAAVMLALIIFCLVSYIRLKKKVSTAIRLDGNIYECENIETPFVLGIIKPFIYLPTGLLDVEKTYILKHEMHHIRRLDYLIKPAAFLALCIHWFNPLAWAGFALMSVDMEMSCDERVVKELGSHIKKDYTRSLLSISIGRKLIGYSPLAFGEGGVKTRIKNVLSYRRPSFWAAVACIAVVIALAIGLISNPMRDGKEALSQNSQLSSGPADTVGQGQAPGSGGSTGSQVGTAEADSKKAPEEIRIEDLTEKTIVTPDKFEKTKYPLIAQLPEDDIFLYGQPDGVVLKYGNRIQTFDWNYLGPGFILPILEKYDIDNDGAGEIVCQLNVGSGSGVYVDELHVLKPDNTGKYIDYIYRDYIGQVKSLLSHEYDEGKKSIKFEVGNKSYTYAFPEEYRKLTFKDIIFGNIVRFDMSDGIKIDMPLSIEFEGNPVPQPAGDASFQGKIVFKDGKFLIESPRIVNLK